MAVKHKQSSTDGVLQRADSAGRGLSTTASCRRAGSTSLVATPAYLRNHVKFPSSTNPMVQGTRIQVMACDVLQAKVSAVQWTAQA